MTLTKRQPQSVWKLVFLWLIALSSASALLVYQYKRHGSTSFQCQSSESCRDTRHAFLLGGDPSQQVEAERQLQMAADVYRKWVGEELPHGLLRLNSNLPLPQSGYDNIAWSLTFDRRRSRILGSPGPIKTNGVKRPLTAEEDAPSSKDFFGPSLAALDEPEVLGHEICHQLALLVFQSAPRSGQALSEALGEAAAVSCETSSLKRTRVLEFARVLRQGRHVPWEKFFKISHPVNDSSLLARLEKEGGAGKSNLIKFSLDRHSELGERVSAYYGQVAALALFLERESCPEYRALGDLLQFYDSQVGIDEWLSVHGQRNCLPHSMSEFTKAIQSFVYSYEQQSGSIS